MIVVVLFHPIVIVRSIELRQCEQVGTIVGSLVCSNDKLAQELVAQTLKVVTIKLGIVPIFQIRF